MTKVTQETNDVVGLIERLDAWTTFDDADSLLNEAADALQSQSARIAELRDALSAMILEHDAGGITLATMREARSLTKDSTNG